MSLKTAVDILRDRTGQNRNLDGRPMPPQNRPAKWLFKLVIIVFAALFAMTAWLEARIFVGIPVTARARFDAMIKEEISAGLSPYSQRLFLDECVEAMDGYYGRLQPSERRIALASVCEQKALRYVAWTPTFAYSWYVAARTALQKGDRDRFIERMGKAYEAAPAEGWMAMLRLPVWNENADLLTTDLREYFTRDIELLLQTKSTARTLIRYSNRYPRLRERVVAMVEKASPEVQKQFLGAMRDVLGSERGR